MGRSSAETRFCTVDDNREMDVMLGRDNRILSYNLSGELLFEKKCPKKSARLLITAMIVTIFMFAWMPKKPSW